ncbi:MAG: hypothetical protein CFH35_01113 [Alphaproteobacteria bacterium MarineAlpha9_Bin5]|nr:MAG: hypothetical protein CFH35_01113 [Alphaproteobacteria bacterium MarineAlpha9_Bin5]
MHAMNINKSISKICVGVFSERYFLIFKLRLLTTTVTYLLTKGNLLVLNFAQKLHIMFNFFLIALICRKNPK